MKCSPFLAGLAAIAGILAVPMTAAARTIPPPTPYYLALGDSVPVWNGTHSYPYLIVAHHPRANLQLVDMACSSETTSTMIKGSYCAPGGSQYQNAITFLDAHRGNVGLITIDIGGNDLVACIDAANPATCAVNALATMESNLTFILTGLRSAAGPGVPIVGMNVYNPLLGDWLAPDRTLLTEATAGIQLLNADLEQVFSEAGSPVADVFDAFRTSEMNHLVPSQWGSVPLAVKKACTLLDIYCQKGQPEGFGDDPDDAGAVVIAHAFDKVIRLHPT